MQYCGICDVSSGQGVRKASLSRKDSGSPTIEAVNEITAASSKDDKTNNSKKQVP